MGALKTRFTDRTRRADPRKAAPSFGKIGRIQRWRWRAQDGTSWVSAGLASLLERERDAGAGFLLVPVWLALGIGLYFLLPREPLVAAFPMLAILAMILTKAAGDRVVARGMLVAVALVCISTSLAQFQTWRIDTKMLPRGVVAEVDAVIETIELRANGSARYTMAVGDEGLSIRRYDGEMPKRIRATARKALPNARIGDRLQGLSRIGPSPGPAVPGGYDFGFQAWFAGIGASGFFLGQPDLIAVEGGWGGLASVRSAIAGTIRRALPGEGGAIAVALIVGDRSGISESTAEALRRSGLAHILAISGLHMTLVVGTLLFGIRMALAAVPGLALTRPIRKWAAAAALVGATGYLAISGGGISAQRAWFMVSIMLLAVLADRRAISLRNVAMAAIAVLALSPSALLTPGFQMSFAAVAALVAAYETLSRRRLATMADNKPFKARGLPARLATKVAKGGAGLALTSLIAGVATGIFAAYHFNRVAPMGLVANLAAMPFVSTIVMPSALVSAIAMPFGLESYPLAVMDWGTARVVDVAKWASATGPGGATGRIALGSAVLAALALTVFVVLRTRLRLLGVPILLLAAIPQMQTSKPDMLIAQDGRQIALIDHAEDKNGLALLRPNAAKFNSKLWSQWLGIDPDAATEAAFRCDDFGCVGRLNDTVIAAPKSIRTLATDCRMADVIVFPFAVSNACDWLGKSERPTIFDKTTLENSGAVALRFDEAGNSFTAEPSDPAPDSVADARPWNRHRVATRSSDTGE